MLGSVLGYQHPLAASATLLFRTTLKVDTNLLVQVRLSCGVRLTRDSRALVRHLGRIEGCTTLLWTGHCYGAATCLLRCYYGRLYDTATARLRQRYGGAYDDEGVELRVRSRACLRARFEAITVSIPMDYEFSNRHTNRRRHVANFRARERLNVVRVISPVPAIRVSVNARVRTGLIRVVASTCARHVSVRIESSNVPDDSNVRRRNSIIR